MKDPGFALGIALAAGAVALGAYALRRGEASPGAESQPGGGGGAAPFSVFDPATGQILGPSEAGLDTLIGPDGKTRTIAEPREPTSPLNVLAQLSPQGEAEFLRQNAEANRILIDQNEKATTDALRQGDEANRQAAAEARKQTMAANLTTGLVALPVLAGAVKVAQHTAGLLRRPPPISAGAVVGAASAGVALGVGTVAALQKTGALDAVQRYGAAQNISPTRAAVAKNIALPLSVPGAVVAAAAGRGTVVKNLQTAVKGTVVDKGVKWFQGWGG